MRRARGRRNRQGLRHYALWLVAGGLALVSAWYGSCLMGMIYLKWFRPFTTGVQIERRVESWFDSKPYSKRYQWRPIEQISPHLAHAIVASEDSAFYEHDGIDWDQLERAWDERQKRGRIRGASTISQQLVKNLFLTNHRNPLRKVAEFALVPAAEWVWSKERILELYLNVIEWGPGVYGAEAAAQYHYRTSSARLSREQAARLAAVVPSPLRRKPAAMNRYSNIVLRRMTVMGW